MLFVRGDGRERPGQLPNSLSLRVRRCPRESQARVMVGRSRLESSWRGRLDRRVTERGLGRFEGRRRSLSSLHLSSRFFSKKFQSPLDVSPLSLSLSNKVLLERGSHTRDRTLPDHNASHQQRTDPLPRVRSQHAFLERHKKKKHFKIRVFSLSRGPHSLPLFLCLYHIPPTPGVRERETHHQRNTQEQTKTPRKRALLFPRDENRGAV
jgi:hypothetical protein